MTSTGSEDPPGGAPCSVCLDFDRAEEDAELTGDLSLATDWRVLRRRHVTADHPERAAPQVSSSG
ncbi:hypothetical protein [Streptomyces sp. NPDC001770]